MSARPASIVAVRVHSIPTSAQGSDFGCLLELETDQGLIGTGIGVHGMAKSVLNLAESFLIGHDPQAVVALWSSMCEHLRSTQASSLDIRAAAALDMALWDLKGKATGDPLWRSVGGNRPRAFACLNARESGPEDGGFFQRFSADARDYAFRAGKLCLAPGSESDLRALEMMHSALSQNTATPDMLVSMEKRWPAEQAIPRITAIEQRFDLVGVQDSSSTWTAAELKQVSSGVFAGICIGATHYDAQGLFTHLDHNDIDILTIDPALSGITGSLQIAEAAYGFELPVILAAGPGNMGAQLASVMPTLMYLEVDQPSASHGPVQSNVRIEAGRALAGDQPGHAVSVDPVHWSGP